MRLPNKWSYDSDEDYYEAMEEWREAQDWYADHADEIRDAERDRLE